MSKHLLMVAVAAAGTVAALSTTSVKAQDISDIAREMSTTEKCYGIVRAHKNDCKTMTHACAGRASQSRSKKDFVVVPVGLCTKIAGGSTESK